MVHAEGIVAPEGHGVRCGTRLTSPPEGQHAEHDPAGFIVYVREPSRRWK